MPTLATPPEIWEEIPIGHGTVADGADGAAASAALFSGDERRFRLQWIMASAATKATLSTLHDDTLGGTLTMDWTPPGEAAAIKVRFLKRRAGYATTLVAEGVHAIDINIIEAPEHRTPSAI